MFYFIKILYVNWRNEKVIFLNFKILFNKYKLYLRISKIFIFTLRKYFLCRIKLNFV